MISDFAIYCGHRMMMVIMITIELGVRNQDDDEAAAPQILIETFCFCNDCVVGGAIGTPDN